MLEPAAIVLHIAERHAELLLENAGTCTPAVAWIFAAMGTEEPPVVERSMAVLLKADRPWLLEGPLMLDERVRVRLPNLSRWLAGLDWLENELSTADIMLVTVLRRFGGSGLLEKQPTLASYVAPGEARPVFGGALDAQVTVFTASAR